MSIKTKQKKNSVKKGKSKKSNRKTELVMGGMYTILQLRLYTPEMKEFAKSIIPISNDIKEFFKNISLGFLPVRL